MRPRGIGEHGELSGAKDSPLGYFGQYCRLAKDAGSIWYGSFGLGFKVMLIDD